MASTWNVDVNSQGRVENERQAGEGYAIGGVGILTENEGEKNVANSTFTRAREVDGEGRKRSNVLRGRLMAPGHTGRVGQALAAV